MLSEEEKKAIEYLTKYIHWETAGERSLETDIETVLNLITKLQKENETTCKLNANMSKRHLNDIFKIKNYEKQIDLMAEYISNLDIDEDICKEQADNNCDDINREAECKDCIKQYFEKQVEEKGEEKCQTGVKEI